MKVGLVLEGGGMRGLYTAGVLDAFLDAGIKVDGLVSVSAGALFGVNFLSGQRGRALRYNKRFIRDKNYISLLSWLKTGNMVNREMAYYKIPMELDIFDQEAFAKSGVPFYVTVTNLETGQAEYPKIDHVFDQMEYLRASSALPLVSKIVEIDGKKYLDGGLTDSIPVDFAKSLGFDKLIVILTQPFEYRKKPSSGRLYRLFYKDYPKFVEVASKRYQHYNEAVEKIIQMEEAGEVYVIRPDQALDVGRLERDPDKLEAVYEIGIRDGQATLPGLKVYLQASE
ncbi:MULTISPECIES: patatin family protein [unclassified Streptococcus]|uniref:patatin-like phospholipase family protein n=1 Tax=unclassified Streptococcus TaxID=2608887 RepID=UPI0018A97926|nr:MULTISPECIES: patatin family protein [unclassified Streptococcus]MBF8969953.1 patatin family protein [Streptococcus sp. NLN76]MBG9367131.1 patatin family protein [Streptococcus sp. NLN64]